MPAYQQVQRARLCQLVPAMRASNCTTFLSSLRTRKHILTLLGPTKSKRILRSWWQKANLFRSGCFVSSAVSVGRRVCTIRSSIVLSSPYRSSVAIVPHSRTRWRWIEQASVSIHCLCPLGRCVEEGVRRFPVRRVAFWGRFRKITTGERAGGSVPTFALLIRIITTSLDQTYRCTILRASQHGRLTGQSGRVPRVSAGHGRGYV